MFIVRFPPHPLRRKAHKALPLRFVCSLMVKVQKAQKQARGWSRGDVATAIRLVAALNADVKGVAADADYALEKAVRAVAQLAAGGR